MTRTACLLLFFTGCGATALSGPNDTQPPSDGHALLTIVGTTNVFLDAGAQQTLTVKYTDDAGAPLAGEVQFAVHGTYADSVLQAASAITDAQGLATVTLAGGQSAAAFRIEAGALDATPVDWSIAVQGAIRPPPELDLSGTYKLESQFDLVSGLPGAVGEVVNAIIAMTDGPNDPATWLIDEALTEIDSSTITGAVSAVRPELDAYVNGLLVQAAPSVVTDFVTFGSVFGQVTQQFGLESQLVVTKDAAGGYTATHTVTGVSFTINGYRYEYTLADLGISPVSAQHVAVSLDASGGITIADHTLAVSYGQIAVFALDKLVIPMLDGLATNVTQLLKDEIDCPAIGANLASYVGIGSASTYESACNAGLDLAGSYVENQIASLGGTASSFQIHGTAKGVDANGDGSIDSIQTGEWTGVLDFTVADATLTAPGQTFSGARQ